MSSVEGKIYASYPCLSECQYKIVKRRENSSLFEFYLSVLPSCWWNYCLHWTQL